MEYIIACPFLIKSIAHLTLRSGSLLQNNVYLQSMQEVHEQVHLHIWSMLGSGLLVPHKRRQPLWVSQSKDALRKMAQYPSWLPGVQGVLAAFRSTSIHGTRPENPADSA